MNSDRLTTINHPFCFSGRGLHSGVVTRISIRPAAPGSGIIFRRVDLPGFPLVPARWNRVGSLRLCTTLLGDGGAHVTTVEHLMAALSALEIDDAWIDTNGPEIPILDGSAAPFVSAIIDAGMRRSSVPRRSVRIIRPVEVLDGDKLVRLEPYDGFALDCGIEFAHPVIGRSVFRSNVTPQIFMDSLASARTFALASEISQMHADGLALGGSLENAVVVGDNGVLNAGGLRFVDEFVRHKALDAIGDLALLGAPIIGRYVSWRAGHAMNNALVRALMASPEAWRWDGPADGLWRVMEKEAA